MSIIAQAAGRVNTIWLSESRELRLSGLGQFRRSLLVDHYANACLTPSMHRRRVVEKTRILAVIGTLDRTL